MKKIVLIACASRKKAVQAAAGDLYDSSLFKLSMHYARRCNPDAIFILSAKYGLVQPNEVIRPYDVTLKRMNADERRMWATRVIEQLREHADVQHDHFTVLAGKDYREHLLPHLTYYDVPMKGLPIGKQLQYLKRMCNE